MKKIIVPETPYCEIAHRLDIHLRKIFFTKIEIDNFYDEISKYNEEMNCYNSGDSRNRSIKFFKLKGELAIEISKAIIKVFNGRMLE